MPLDVLGCTRATLMRSTSLRSCLKWLGNLFKMHRDGDRSLQLLIFNEEFLVSASHQLVLITSLPFVHTARRSYRLSDPVNNSDWCSAQLLDVASESKDSWTLSLRGRRSRNKVSVGEPAEGSFALIQSWLREFWLWGMLAVRYLLAELVGDRCTFNQPLLGLVRVSLCGHGSVFSGLGNEG